MFGRATIRLGIGPHSSVNYAVHCVNIVQKSFILLLMLFVHKDMPLDYETNLPVHIQGE